MNLNILLVGKSGAGKSSFANYLFNKEVFKSGKGKPVTGWEDALESHSFSYDKYTLNVFDTVGMEPDNMESWESRIDDFVRSKHRKNDVVGNELHGVFYIVNAASSRVEPIEEKMINEFSNKHGLPTTVVLTNSDNADRKQLQAIKDLLGDYSPVEVCSVSVKKRGGWAEKYGRDEVIDSFITKFNSVFTKRALQDSMVKISKTFSDMQIEINKAIDKSELSVFNLIKIDELDFDTLIDESSIELCFDELSPILEFLDELGVVDGSELQDKIDSSVDFALESFESEMQARFDKIEEGLEDRKFFGVIKELTSLGYKMLRIKTTMKEMVNVVTTAANNKVNKDILEICEKILPKEDVADVYRSSQLVVASGLIFGKQPW